MPLPPLQTPARRLQGTLAAPRRGIQKLTAQNAKRTSSRLQQRGPNRLSAPSSTFQALLLAQHPHQNQNAFFHNFQTPIDLRIQSVVPDTLNFENLNTLNSPIIDTFTHRDGSITKSRRGSIVASDSVNSADTSFSSAASTGWRSALMLDDSKSLRQQLGRPDPVPSGAPPVPQSLPQAASIRRQKAASAPSSLADSSDLLEDSTSFDSGKATSKLYPSELGGPFNPDSQQSDESQKLTELKGLEISPFERRVALATRQFELEKEVAEAKTETDNTLKGYESEPQKGASLEDLYGNKNGIAIVNGLEGVYIKPSVIDATLPPAQLSSLAISKKYRIDNRDTIDRAALEQHGPVKQFTNEELREVWSKGYNRENPNKVSRINNWLSEQPDEILGEGALVNGTLTAEQLEHTQRYKPQHPDSKTVPLDLRPRKKTGESKAPGTNTQMFNILQQASEHNT
jgi:hypothetical protein